MAADVVVVTPLFVVMAADIVVVTPLVVVMAADVVVVTPAAVAWQLQLSYGAYCRRGDCCCRRGDCCCRRGNCFINRYNKSWLFKDWKKVYSFRVDRGHVTLSVCDDLITCCSADVTDIAVYSLRGEFS